MEKICVRCGKVHSRRGNYCSQKCYNEAYYSKNVDRLKEKSKEHYEDNKQYYIDRVVRIQKENPEKVRNYMREWRKRKKEENK